MGEAVLRAVNGMRRRPVTMAIAYALTAFPPDKRPMAIVLAISVPRSAQRLPGSSRSTPWRPQAATAST